MANPSDRLFPMKYESKMRVAMYYNNRDVRLEELAVPKIGPGELLVANTSERHLRQRS